MKVLAVGDLVGECGVRKLKEMLPIIQKENQIDFTIVNGENAASGMGMTSKIYAQLDKMKIDCITMGNHTWGKKDIFSFIDNDKILRPANYAEGIPGHGYFIFDCNGKKIAVINMLGRTDMNVLSENPFICIDKILNTIKADYIFLDFHAEATAEKIAMGYYLDGKITAMFGTHTHVQTADEKILKNGTGYITDVGMTGPIDSVIGMDINVSIKRFVTTLPERYKEAEGKAMLNGVVFEINDDTGRTDKVYRIQVK